MNEKQFFKKNLKLIEKVDLVLARELIHFVPEIDFCWSQSEELNLKRFYDETIYYYHSQTSCKKEADEWFQQLPLTNQTQVIFIYGVGLGYYYEAAKSWLKEESERILVFLEMDLSVIHCLCQTALGYELLKDPQVQLFYFKNLEESRQSFLELTWKYLQSIYIISALKLYKETSPHEFLELQHELVHDLVEKKTYVEEFMEYGLSFFKNFFLNLLELPQSYLGNGLFNCFKNIPAIICGAGPSLDKVIDQLPGIRDRALLFAGGSSLNALIPKGIIPDFGVAIDPNPAQYSRVISAKSQTFPFFYRNRLLHRALKSIEGPRLYLTGSGGYKIANWFEEKLGIAGEDLDEGSNLINFAIEIAHVLGCYPIILIGLDLALTNQQWYAKDIITNLNLVGKDFQQDNNFESKCLLKEDIYGKPVLTLWKWIIEGKWIEKFAETHPEVQIINATEGGIGFKGIKNLSLSAVIEQYLSKPQPQIKEISKEIVQHSLSFISKEEIHRLLETFKDSLDKAIDLLVQIIEAYRDLTRQIEEGKMIPPDLQTISTALLESELEKEIAFEYLIDTFNQVYLHAHYGEAQEINSSKKRMSKKNRALKKLHLHQKRLNFLKNTAKVNKELIQHVLLGHVF